MRHSTLLVFALAILGLFDIRNALADAPSPGATSTRVYDVRDLVLTVQNYPLSGALVPPTQIGQADATPPENVPTYSPQPGGLATPTVPSPGAPIDQLMKVIVETVDPTSWKITGGNPGTISAMNGELFINQTSENHIAIESILNEMRRVRASMVRIRADWVLLDPGAVDSILKNGAEDKSAVAEVGRDLLAKLPPQTVRYSATISCFSGQTVHLNSGHARTTITAATPTVATSAVAYEVKPEIVQYGLSLQVTPTVGDDSVTLDVMSEASEAFAPTAAPTTANGVDRINAVVQQLHTTVQLPIGKPVLVGGMTVEPTSSQPAGPQLYLVIEADGGK